MAFETRESARSPLTLYSSSTQRGSAWGVGSSSSICSAKKKNLIDLIFTESFSFSLFLTDDIREHHLYLVISCWWKETRITSASRCVKITWPSTTMPVYFAAVCQENLARCLINKLSISSVRTRIIFDPGSPPPAPLSPLYHCSVELLPGKDRIYGDSEHLMTEIGVEVERIYARPGGRAGRGTVQILETSLDQPHFRSNKHSKLRSHCQCPA